MADPDAERIVGALFEPLVHLDTDGRVVPGAAARWEVLEEGRRFRFHLRPATFHDGQPVTADAFARSFNAITDGTAAPPSFLAYLLGAVEGAEAAAERGAPLSGVEVEDARTLVLTLREPQPGFLGTLTHPSLVPLPDQAFQNPRGFAQQPVGNGPFTMIEPRERGSFLRLRAFAEHRTPPLLEEVVFQIYTDDRGGDGLWEDLTAGLLHVAEIPPDRLEDAEATFGVSTDGYRGPGVLTGVSSTTYLYGFDTTQEPYDDPRFRSALSLAIDRDVLAEDIMQDTRVAADSLVPPAIVGSQPGACDHCEHDPVAARTLLADVQADRDLDDVTVTLSHLRGRTHAAIAQRMATDIEAALDLDVELDARDLSDLVPAVRAGEVPVFWVGWEASEPGPGAYLRPLFHSSQIGRDNLTRYADEDVDRLLDTARAAPSVPSSIPFYRTAERRILADAPVLPLLWHRLAVVVTGDVRELYWSPYGRLDLSEVWLADRS